MTDFRLDGTGVDTVLLVLLITLETFYKQSSISHCGYTIENHFLLGSADTKNTTLTPIGKKSNKCS